VQQLTNGRHTNGIRIGQTQTRCGIYADMGAHTSTACFKMGKSREYTGV
jgi:hypothetical protein